MEKAKRRRFVRRHEQLEVSLDDRKGIERRVRNRRSELARRMKQVKVMIERRTGTDQRAV